MAQMATAEVLVAPETVGLARAPVLEMPLVALALVGAASLAAVSA